jgi:hypothetical protein
MGQVDCVQHEQLCAANTQDITSFPTLKAVVYGKYIEYNGILDQEGLTSFVQRILNSGSKNLEDEGGYASFMKKYLTAQRPIAVCSGSDTHMQVNFDLACMKSNLYTCAYTETAEINKAAGIPFPSIFVQRMYDNEDSIIYADESIFLSSHKLEDFLYQHAFPRILPVSKDNQDAIFSTDRPGYDTHVVVVGNSASSAMDSVFGVLRELYPKYWDKCVFTSVDTSSESEYVSNVLADIQVPKTSTAIMAIKTQVSQVAFYNFPGENISQGVDRQALKEWIDSVLDETAEVVRTVTTA